MGCKIATIFSTLIFLVVMFGLVTSDITQDKEECTQKLIALANCLPFVSGEAKTPPIDCCTGVKEVVDKSKRCLCILVKDHDDPSLGFTINVTLALQLPNDCKAPTNLTQCIDILHLAPKSKVAKIFEDFQKTMEKNSTTTPITPVSDAPAPSWAAALADRIGLNCFQTNYCPRNSFHCAKDCKTKGFHFGGNCFEGLTYCCCQNNV
ncbi:non-specific lipid transfer protein GPI-anchored 6-like isoform X1 [Trifolium pratense]|uniref:non-specific lipid transfer protein GPI-anchored 6-like isoform X1 n=1 Tax=Trifolium pratense TaxID=57577 RepID=UPI001E691C91|nr:non-specific lipid transfer protein GPI-anchored 6-like isoform X1 [Trifolium pratense]